MDARILRYLELNDDWPALWGIIASDPILVDRVWKYLQDRIEDWERDNRKPIEAWNAKIREDQP